MECSLEANDVESLIDLVHRQCERKPENIALKTTAHTLSYKELWDEVNKMKVVLSKSLRQDTSSKEIIAISLPNSVGYIVSLLSVTACGGAFLPLPVDMPKERLISLLNDACVRKVIKTKDSDNIISSSKVLLNHTISGEDIVLVDVHVDTTKTDKQKDDKNDDTNYKCKLVKNERSEDFSYVMYTSGSTGKPKGVKVKESGVINVARALIKAWCIAPEDVIAQFASIGFDASIVEIFIPLLSGASLAILKEQERLGENFIQVMNELCVTCVTLPSSALSVYRPDMFKTLQKIISAGEVCSLKIARKWAANNNIRFFNAYGLTEATVCAMSYEYLDNATPANVEDLPIGKAIDGIEIYLLDDFLEKVQRGIVGEIYIGGKGVTHGYIGHARQLSGNRFLKDPFVDVPTRMFKTGDYAVEDIDGNIYFMGRCDDQVKIRGHRVDLQEIENAINSHSEIALAVVIVHKCKVMKDNFLAAFVISVKIDIRELREYLSKLLPKYMIPTFFKQLKESDIPKTINCKIDRKSLEIDESVHEQNRRLDPVILTEEEFLVANIWVKVLKFEESASSYLNGDTSFRELGGDSLHLVLLQRMIEENINQTIPFKELANADALKDFAELIRRYKRTTTLSTYTDVHRTNETDSLRRLIIRDSILNDSILREEVTMHSQPNDTSAEDSNGAGNIKGHRNILLSGVTGFLGTFILSELLEQTGDHVFCMVRSTCKVKGLSRIIQAMKNFNLWKSEYMSRITVIVSDLTQEKFGITKDVYSMLEDKIDLVFMNGAEVNMNLSYDKLRSANVQSMEEAIKLALSGPRKYLFATSSLSVFLFPPHDSDMITFCRRLCTEAEFLDDPLSIIGGYGQTKWAMERLVMQALDVLPGGAIFRPALITGRSTDGAGPKNDLFSSILFGMKKLGFYPDLDFPFDMVPVDFCAKAIVEILTQACSFKKDKMARIYHLYNKDTIQFHKIFEDMDVKPCSLSDWRQKLLTSEDDNRELVSLTPYFMSEFWDNAARFLPVFDTSNTDNCVSENTRDLMKPATELLAASKIYLGL